VSFFERYFAALDGPDPMSSLALVAEDVEFSIQWARGNDRGSRQFVGGRAELRAFIEAGDMSDWAHHVLFGGSAGDVEFALGETRYADGERIGTFLAVAQLDRDGRMVRYMVARSPAIAFEAGRVDAGAPGSEAGRVGGGDAESQPERIDAG
jgi:ketosteroid isomerase-like protein